jgi:GxxExxY protein
MDRDRGPGTYAIIGAAIEVHRHLGHGFLEAVYQEALAIEFESRAVPFERETEVPVVYKDTRLRCSYRVDFLCFGEVIVEIKALRQLGGSEEAQTINYLKATGFHTGLILNFGAPRLEHKRFVFTGDIPHLRPSAPSADSCPSTTCSKSTSTSLAGRNSGLRTHRKPERVPVTLPRPTLRPTRRGGSQGCSYRPPPCGSGGNPSSLRNSLCFRVASWIFSSAWINSAWVAARSISISSTAVLTYREMFRL